MVNLFHVTIWRHAMCFDTADVYVAMEKDTEASACVQEADLIFPFSPDVLFQV